MDAVRLLEEQHHEVKSLFEEFDSSRDDGAKLRVFEAIADSIAIHVNIEERCFYPAVRARQTEEEVEQAYDEHLEIKRLLADAMRSTGELGFDIKVAALKGAVERHVAEEESDLFPSVRMLMTADQRETLGEEMEALTEALRLEGNARLGLEVGIEPPAMQP
jgi:hypothetical protein